MAGGALIATSKEIYITNITENKYKHKRKGGEKSPHGKIILPRTIFFEKWEEWFNQKNREPKRYFGIKWPKYLWEGSETEGAETKIENRDNKGSIDT